MSMKETFEQHVVHTTINGILEAILQIPKKYPEYNGVDDILKLKYSAEYLKGIIDRVNYYITPLNLLDSINANLQNVQVYINQFLQNNASQLVNAKQALEAAISITPQLILNDNGAKNTVKIDSRDIFESMQKSAETTTSAVAKNRTEFETKTQELISQVEASKQNLSATQQRVDAYLTSLQTAFNTSEKERTTQFNETNKLYAEQFKKLVDKTNTASEENATKLIKDAEAIIDQLKADESKAAKILQIVSNTGFAGNYSKNADAEQKSANIMRGISIVIFIVVSALALWVLFTFKKDGVSWNDTLVKLLATSLPSTLATYLARESNKHRKLAHKYRNMELELSALDAFIENLKPEDRNKLKIEITRKLFSDDISATLDTSKSDAGNATLSLPENLLQMIIDILKKKI